jgi:hypothetical protein
MAYAARTQSDYDKLAKSKWGRTSAAPAKSAH